MRPTLLALLAAFALLAGCAAPPDADEPPTKTPTARGPSSSPTPSPFPSPTAPAWPQQAGAHHLSPSSLTARAASVDGLGMEMTADGLTLEMDARPSGLADHVALLAHDAVIGGQTGVLVILPGAADIVIDGEARYQAQAVRLDVARRDAVAIDRARGGFDDHRVGEQLRNHSFGNDAFFSDPLALDLLTASTVRAQRIVFVTAVGAQEMTTARVDQAGWFSATAALVRRAAPEAVDLVVGEPRGSLAMDAARGELAFETTSRSLDGPALLTLARGAAVSLAPGRDGGVELLVRGAAFQAYAEGAPLFGASLRVRLAETSIPSPTGDQSRGIAFYLDNLDMGADAVISSVRIEGSRDPLDMPGATAATAILIDDARAHPLAVHDARVALPGGIAGEVGSVGLFGTPAPIPQVVAAGVTFESILFVEPNHGAFTATLVIDGNFEPTTVTLRVG